MTSIWILYIVFDDGMAGDNHIVGTYDSEEKVHMAKQNIISNHLNAYITHKDLFQTKRGDGVEFSIIKTSLNSMSLSDRAISILT